MHTARRTADHVLLLPLPKGLVTESLQLALKPPEHHVHQPHTEALILLEI